MLVPKLALGKLITPVLASVTVTPEALFKLPLDVIDHSVGEPLAVNVISNGGVTAESAVLSVVMIGKRLDGLTFI